MDRRKEMGSEDDHCKAVSALADSGYGGTQSKSSAENSSNSADLCSRSGTGSSGSDHLGTACSSGEGTSKETNSTVSSVQTKDFVEPKKFIEDLDAPAGGSEIVNAAQLAIRCLKKLTCQDMLDFEPKGPKGPSHLSSRATLEDLPKLTEEGCTLLVSLQTMCVIQTSSGTKDVLGFSDQMLCARSFLDFVYPRDRFTFTSEVTSMMRALGEGKPSGESCVFYIRMRGSKNLELAGFDVKSKRTVYKPYRGFMQIKVVRQSKGIEGPATAREPEYYAVVKLVPIKSAYEEAYDRQDVLVGSFGTRHTSSCHMSHVDAAAIPYLGYLPQDLIGNSIFDYYHPDDLGYLKKDFESVLQRAGATCAGAKSRFRAHNGCYLVLSTDWSCFVNPWTYRLEFVIGQHRVVESPSNSNVFLIPKETDAAFGDKNRQESAVLQDEIRALLSKALPADQKVALASETPLLRATAKAPGEMTSQMEESRLADNSGPELVNSSSQQESVLMGHVSPLHEEQEGSRSNTSGSSATTYNQLNYRESIMRFFQSQQKTGSSDDSTASGGKKLVPFRSPILSTTDDDVNAMDSVSNIHSKKHSNESSSNHLSHVTSSNEVMELGTSVSKNSMERTMQKAQQQSSDHSGQTACEHCTRGGTKRENCQVCSNSSGDGGGGKNPVNTTEAVESQRKRGRQVLHHKRHHEQQGSIAARIGCIERHLVASGSNFVPESRADGAGTADSCGHRKKQCCSHEPPQQQQPVPQLAGLTEELLRKHTKTESKLFVRQHRPARAKPAGLRSLAPDAPRRNILATGSGATGTRAYPLQTMDPNAVKVVSAAAVAASGGMPAFDDIASMDVLIDKVSEAFLRRQYEQRMEGSAAAGPRSVEPAIAFPSQHFVQGPVVQHPPLDGRNGPATLVPSGPVGRSVPAQWPLQQERGLKRPVPEQVMIGRPGIHKRLCRETPTNLPVHTPAAVQGFAMHSRHPGGQTPMKPQSAWMGQPLASQGAVAIGGPILPGQRRPMPSMLAQAVQPVVAYGPQIVAAVPMEQDEAVSLPCSCDEHGRGCDEERSIIAQQRQHLAHLQLRGASVGAMACSAVEVHAGSTLYGRGPHQVHHQGHCHGGCNCRAAQGCNPSTSSRPRLSDSVALPSSSSFRSDFVKPVNHRVGDCVQVVQDSDASGSTVPTQGESQTVSNDGNNSSAVLDRNSGKESNDDSFSFSLSDGSTDRGLSSSNNGCGSSASALRPRRSNLPPWMDGLDFNQETAYTYTMPTAEMNDVLALDRAALDSMQQPIMVDAQLDQLYQDMNADDVSSLGYDEGTDSSSGNEGGSSGEKPSTSIAVANAGDEASAFSSSSNSGDGNVSGETGTSGDVNNTSSQHSTAYSSGGSGGSDLSRKAEARRRKKAIFMESDGHVPHPESSCQQN